MAKLKANPINSKYYFTKSKPIKQEIIEKIPLNHLKKDAYIGKEKKKLFYLLFVLLF